ncbi:MAG: Heparinase [Nitrospira sp.]|nr:MAG: Heparinase [Nitrospira sp.]
MNIACLQRYAHTLRYLRASQWWHQLLYRLPKLSPTPIPLQPVSLRPCVRLLYGIAMHQPDDRDTAFTFLHREKVFDPACIPWACVDMPKLWRYNLHYFDYLQHPQRSIQNKSHLITDWIEHNPQGTVDAWEPYTVSLRMVNWIKFFLAHKELTQQGWTESLYLQALWLEQNIEYHILANHYLKNGVALFFAGMYFDGQDANRWLKKGLQILREELDEQFLQDGGHFERSPMYHSICVMDYLDVLNLMQSSSAVMKFEEVGHFRARTIQSLDFLHDLCFPDGEIPLFNDSAFGIAPRPSDIFDYAVNVIGYVRPETRNGLAVNQKTHSGYYILRKGIDMMVIDCGLIGPDYQPGHAHCDTLSYELTVMGRRMIVDSGVHDYEAGPHRAYARSTKAHNTIMIDGEEQSEVWGLFRVARRARPIHAMAMLTPDQHAVFEGAHDGYRRLSGSVTHRRRIEFDGNTTWCIADDLDGAGKHRAQSFIHLHPDFTAVIEGRYVRVLDASGAEWASLEFLTEGEIGVEDSWFFPEFGRAIKNQTITHACSGAMPMRCSYRISATH